MRILLFKNHGIIPDLIRFFSRGKYNHAAILTSTGIVYEAITSGVRKTPLSNKIFECNKNNTYIDYFKLKKDLPPYEELQIIDFLEKQLGKPYDFMMVAGFVSHSTSQGRKSYGKWFCSELVCAAIGEIKKILNTDYWKISPEMISYSTEIELDNNS